MWLFFIFLWFLNDFDVLRCSEDVLFWFSHGFNNKNQLSRIHVLEAWFWTLDKNQNHKISWFQFSCIFLANINTFDVLEGPKYMFLLIFYCFYRCLVKLEIRHFGGSLAVLIFMIFGCQILLYFPDVFKWFWCFQVVWRGLFWFSLGFYNQSEQSRINVLEAWFWRLVKDQNHEMSRCEFCFIFLANIHNFGVLDRPKHKKY